MLGERIASQSEVIRAIVSGYSPCCGVPHQVVLVRLAAGQVVEMPGREPEHPVKNVHRRNSADKAASACCWGTGTRAARRLFGRTRPAGRCRRRSAASAPADNTKRRQLTAANGQLAYSSTSKMQLQVKTVVKGFLFTTMPVETAEPGTASEQKK